MSNKRPLPLIAEEEEMLLIVLNACRLLEKSTYIQDGNIKRGVYQLLAALEEKLNTKPGSVDEPGQNG